MTEHKTPRKRSPAYPSMELKEAVEHVSEVYHHEKRHAVPVAVVAKHCGYPDFKSSSALRLIAALKQYGLVVEEGGGDDRKVRVSDLALDILLGDDGDEKSTRAKKIAAVHPEAYKAVWKHFHGELPSDGTLKSHLIRSMDFNDGVVDLFIKKFRATIGYAGLVPTDKIEDEEDDKQPEEIGLTDPKAKPVGPPFSGVFVENYFPKPTARTMQATQQSQPETKREVFTLAEGDVMVQWPARLSASSVEDLEDHLKLILRKVKRSVSDTNIDDEPL